MKRLLYVTWKSVALASRRKQIWNSKFMQICWKQKNRKFEFLFFLLKRGQLTTLQTSSDLWTCQFEKVSRFSRKNDKFLSRLKGFTFWSKLQVGFWNFAISHKFFFCLFSFVDFFFARSRKRKSRFFQPHIKASEKRREKTTVASKLFWFPIQLTKDFHRKRRILKCSSAVSTHNENWVGFPSHRKPK